jgi:hypothetical protein
MKDIEDMLEEQQTWVELYPKFENTFAAMRFKKKGGQVIIETLDELGPLLSSFFTGKAPLDICGFELTKHDGDKYTVEFKEYNDDGFLNGYVSAIQAEIFVKAVSLTLKETPIHYEANAMGFAWRQDKARMMEVMEIVDLMQQAERND